MVGVRKLRSQMPMCHSCFVTISPLPKVDRLFLTMERVYIINHALMLLTSVVHSNFLILLVREEAQTERNGPLEK